MTVQNSNGKQRNDITQHNEQLGTSSDHCVLWESSKWGFLRIIRVAWSGDKFRQFFREQFTSNNGTTASPDKNTVITKS